jgi:hypothetical protein
VKATFVKSLRLESVVDSTRHIAESQLLADELTIAVNAAGQ